MKQVILVFAICLLILGCSQQPAAPVDEGTQETEGGQVSVEVEEPGDSQDATETIAPEPTTPEPEDQAADPGTEPSSSQAKEHKVIINRKNFDPVELTVNVGDTVTWESQDDRTHVVVGKAQTRLRLDPENTGWRSEPMEEGDTFSYTFQEEGEYSYLDAVFGFKGKITVE